MSAVAMLRDLRVENEVVFTHSPRRPATLPLPSLPTLDAALRVLPAVPPQGLLLGIASEGTPLMLNLRNPAPAPLVVIGDAGSGKTGLLRFAAAALIRTHTPAQAQFCVLTPFPDEWIGFESHEHCLGVVNPAASGIGDSLARLAGAIREDPAGSPVLLLVDDPSRLDPAALDVLAWALTEGPAAGLWPLVTLNTEAAAEWSAWLELFPTHIFGRVADATAAQTLAPAPDGGLHNLMAGAQFTLRSQGHWLRFWVPGAEVRGKW